MEIIKNKRILAVIGLVCLLFGTFLPYYTFSFFGITESISLWGYWEGKVVLILTIANTIFIFKDLIGKFIPQLLNSGIGRMAEKSGAKLSLIPTILIAGFVIYLFFRLDVDSEYLKYGLGFYLLWIGIVALVAHAIFYRKSDQQIDQSQQSYNYQQPVQDINNTYSQPNQNTNNMNFQSQQTSQKYCPYCKAQVSADATTCFMCGNKL